MKLADLLIDHLFVTLPHPFGEMQVPLRSWMEHGPGSRPGVRPIAMYDLHTGIQYPLKMLPLNLRKSWFSRLLIHWHVLANPWK